MPPPEDLPSRPGAERRPGAEYLGDGRCRFLVWAPRHETVEVVLQAPGGTGGTDAAPGSQAAPGQGSQGQDGRTIRLEPRPDGYHGAVAEGVLEVRPGDRYMLRLDGDLERPDPASRYQPEGVHGPSEVVDPSAFRWTDGGWTPPSLDEMVTYEAHPGTFSPEGTFEGIAARLDHLVALGVNALEVMPVAQFPGARNWGYDGVDLYAVQTSYGGPEAFRALVDACHARGIAVVLDVVYNHLGPEGNYLDDFGPYFTDKYHTPWGRAVNYDGQWSDDVRAFFVENALYWMADFHVDGLRLDAIHGIFDASAHPFLQELAEATTAFEERTGRRVPLIAESDLNDARIVTPPERYGFGIDAQWSDDFHHSVHALLTGERSGYYSDFGSPEDLVKALEEGYVYSGQRSAYRGRRHGNSPEGIRPNQLVVAIQNHDQVGNRMKGDRFGTLLSFEQQKVAAGMLLLSPFVPLLFMGEEYGETAPFLYFVDHSDKELSAMVRKGRAEEFKAFGWKSEPPDPTAESSFLASKLNWDLAGEGDHRVLLDFYRELIRLRRTLPFPAAASKDEVEAWSEDDVVFLSRRLPRTETLAVFNVGAAPFVATLPPRPWKPLLDSSDARWNGPGRQTPVGLPDGDAVQGEVQVESVEIWAHSFVLLARPRSA